jgi:hypothetical protein
LRTKNIEIDTEAAPQIRALFEAYAAGNKTFEDIRNKAAFLGLHNRRTGKVLVKSQIKHLLQNPVYCGLIRHNGELYEGKHTPIISRELFNKVQEVIKQRARKPRKAAGHNFVYRSLFKCGVCGCSITAETQKGHNYYRCTKKKDNNCNMPYLREEKLTAQIHQAIQKLIVSEELADFLKTRVLEERQELQNSCQNEIKETDKNLNDTDNKFSRLMDLYLDNNISKREYCERKEKLLNDKYKLQKNIEYLQLGQFLWLELLENFINGIDAPKIALKTDDLEKKREFAEKSGSNFTLRLAERGAQKAEAQISLDFQGFWAVLAESHAAEKPKENSEKDFCIVWSGLKNTARTLAGNNNTNAANNP